MRSLLTLVAVGLLAACATEKPAVQPTPPPATEVKVEAPAVPQPEPVPMRPLHTPEPMQLVVVKTEEPIVSFRLVFHSGAADDPKGEEGITNLAATLMKEGGTKELSAAQLLAALFPMAAELSVDTDLEFTTFSGRVHKDHLDRFLKIFTDVLLDPRWDPKELERIRQDELNTVKNYLRGEDDETLGKVALRALLYEGHPYGHWSGGTVQSLSGLTLDQVKAHAAKVFTQDRLVIGLAGAVDDALVAKVKERLSALPKTGAPAVQLPAAPGFRQRAWVLQKDNATTAISMGYSYSLRRDDPDYYPVAFALSYLGEHRQFNGVLFQELREKRGLNYGDYAYPEHFIQEGEGTFPTTNIGLAEQFFSIWLRPVEPQNAMFAARGAVYFLDQLLKDGIPQEKFDTTRGFLEGYTRLWEQTDQRKLGYAIDDLFYGTHDFLGGFRKAMESMTPQSVQEAARRHLRADHLNFVFVAKDADALAKLLREQPPTPIQYPTPKPAEVTALDQTLEVQHLPVAPSLVEIRPVKDFMEK